jgi:putative transposase
MPIEKREGKPPRGKLIRKVKQMTDEERRKRYPSDVTDTQWALLEPLIPQASTEGRPAFLERREIVNGILYVLCSGCSWRMVPHDLPNWNTLCSYFRDWKHDGIWEYIQTSLRQQVRLHLGREAEPSAGSIDSQSIKTSAVRGDARGFDAGKKTVRAKVPSI